MKRKRTSPKHGRFRVWRCKVGHEGHCYHFNRPGLRRRCCWCGVYEPIPVPPKECV